MKQAKARLKAEAEERQQEVSRRGGEPKKSGPKGGRPKKTASRKAIAEVAGIPDATRQRLLEAHVAPPRPAAPAQPALPTPPAPKPMFEIQFKRRGGLFMDDCCIAKFEKDGQPVSVRYKRIVAGVAIPQPDQPQGAAVVLAELYKAKPGVPPAFTALAARVGRWTELRQGLGELRRLFWIQTFVTEPDEAAVEDLGRVPGLRYASEQLPSAVLPAPAHALRESAWQLVNQLMDEGRLTLGPVKATLNQAPEPAARALQCVVTWLLEHPATYKAGLKIKGPSYSWSRPEREIQPAPFDRGEEHEPGSA